MPVWATKAIDYSAGLDIYDNQTDTYYTEEEAKAAPKEVRSRLTMKPRKIGCWTSDLEDLRKHREDKTYNWRDHIE